jgi:hypothetical protein
MPFPRPLVAVLVPLALLSATSGCAFFESIGFAPNRPDPVSVRTPADTRVEPAHVVVRVVLVSFSDCGRRGVTRTRADAEKLARKVLARAQAGADFAELVRMNSDDRHGGGVLAVANWDIPPRADEVEREKLARGVGRTAFSLEPGQVGLVEYDAYESPEGFVVVRRDS